MVGGAAVHEREERGCLRGVAGQDEAVAKACPAGGRRWPLLDSAALEAYDWGLEMG